VEMPESRHVYAVYAVQTENRDVIVQGLTEAGVGTAIYYPIPIHLSEAHSDLGYCPGDFPTSERAARRQLSLPVFPELTQRELAEVAEGVHTVQRTRGLHA
jgi:dTDP-4-amino-4,6-dideoxygalactose transaminase